MPADAERSAEGNPMSRLPSVEDMARERFGNAEGLAIVQKTTLDLAKHYAQRFELEAEDPEVSLITTALAFSRHKEFTLLVELERDLFTRVATSPDGKSYGQVLFNVTKTGAYREIHREVDRLHLRATQYIKELQEIAFVQAREKRTSPE